MLLHLSRRAFDTACRTRWAVRRTVLDIVKFTVGDLHGLSTSHPQFLHRRESVQPLQYRLVILLSQEVLCEFPCALLSQGCDIGMRNYALNRPCFSCSIARASIPSNSAIMFTNASPATVVISVNINRPSR